MQEALLTVPGVNWQYLVPALLELPLCQNSIREVVWRAHSLATQRKASTTQIAGSGLGLISCQG